MAAEEFEQKAHIVSGDIEKGGRNSRNFVRFIVWKNVNSKHSKTSASEKQTVRVCLVPESVGSLGY